MEDEVDVHIVAASSFGIENIDKASKAKNEDGYRKYFYHLLSKGKKKYNLNDSKYGEICTVKCTKDEANEFRKEAKLLANSVSKECRSSQKNMAESLLNSFMERLPPLLLKYDNNSVIKYRLYASIKNGGVSNKKNEVRVHTPAENSLIYRSDVSSLDELSEGDAELIRHNYLKENSGWSDGVIHSSKHGKHIDFYCYEREIKGLRKKLRKLASELTNKYNSCNPDEADEMLDIFMQDCMRLCSEAEENCTAPNDRMQQNADSDVKIAEEPIKNHDRDIVSISMSDLQHIAEAGLSRHEASKLFSGLAENSTDTCIRGLARIFGIIEKMD